MSIGVESQAHDNRSNHGLQNEDWRNEVEASARNAESGRDDDDQKQLKMLLNRVINTSWVAKTDDGIRDHCMEQNPRRTVANLSSSEGSATIKSGTLVWRVPGAGRIGCLRCLVA